MDLRMFNDRLGLDVAAYDRNTQNQIIIAGVSPEAGYKYAMSQNFNAMATRGQYPINNLLNPFAWSKFIKGIKNGMFKSQKFNKPTNAKVRKKIKNSGSK